MRDWHWNWRSDCYGAVAVELRQATALRPDLIVVLLREPQEELQSLMDLLEPVASSTAG